MRRGFAFILSILFICIGNGAFAQEATDTVITPAQTESSDGKAVSFSTITQTTPVDVRKASREKTEALKQSDDYWYANKEPEKPVQTTNTGDGGLWQAAWFWNLLWILALCGIVAVVIGYLASSNIRLFRRQSKTITDEGEEEVFTEDIFSINYDNEIRKAEEAANYRLAVRLWYLSTLKELANRDVINYRADTPNGVYLNALYGGPYYRDFFRLTRAFDYTWYGQFALSEEGYKSAQAQFVSFKKGLPV